MDMNYYVEDKKCCSCGRSEEFHIGKRSYGWEFSFQAWTACEFRAISSWATWKKIVLEYGEVVNEEGDVISAKDFILLVEGTRNSLTNPYRKPLNHYDYCKEKHPDILNTLWKDLEGWSFTNGEFS